MITVDPKGRGRYGVGSENVNAKTTGQDPETLNPIKIRWQDNTLSYLDNVTYYIRFFMISDFDVSLVTDVDPLGDIFNNIPKVVIAETGNTGINIKNLSIKSTVAPNNITNFVSAMEINMELFEPHGLTLFEKMLNAAQELGIFNIHKCPYFLEIGFRGYDDDGNIITNVGANDIADKKNWFYRVVITDVYTKFDQSGASYNMVLRQFDDLGAAPAHIISEGTFNPTGKTIGDVMREYIDFKREAEELSYTYQRHKYDVKIYPLNPMQGDINVSSLLGGGSLDPTNWKIVNVTNNSPTNKNSVSTPGDKELNFAKGQTLDSILEQLFASTVEGQTLTRRSKTTNVYGADTDYVVVPWIVPETKLRTDSIYDVISQDYNRDITYHVFPYLSTRGTGSPDQQLPIIENDKEFNKQRILNRIKNRKLVKRYDYIYTGLNTEVLHLDIQLDLLYKAIIPTFSGITNIDTFRAGSNVNETQKLTQESLKKIEELRVNKQEQQDLLNKINSFRNEKNGSTFDEKAELRYSRLSSRLNVLKAEEAALTPQVQQSRIKTNESLISEKQKARKLLDNRYTSFVEDKNAEFVPNIIPVTIDKSSIDQSQEGRGNAETTTTVVAQSMAIAILNQIKGPGLLELELNIRGDPYWLGRTHLERNAFYNVAISENNSYPNFNTGEMNFLLTFNLPKNIEDEDAPPIIEKNRTFTGVYVVRYITHEFKNGMFTQRLDAVRDINIDVNLIEI